MADPAADPAADAAADPADAEFIKQENARHDEALSQLKKIKKRKGDSNIIGLKFFFEEYEPRCYLFPVFEIVRRLFLSSVLAVFYPGSAQQVAVGLLGAMNSVKLDFKFWNRFPFVFVKNLTCGTGNVLVPCLQLQRSLH